MKVIIITEFLSHYRIPFYNHLSKFGRVELTVAHTEIGQINRIYEFQQLCYEKSTFRNLFFYASNSELYKKVKESDVIICMFNLRFLDLYKCLYVINKPVVLWGIGLSSNDGLGKKNLIFDYLRVLAAKRAKALILYSKIPFSFYLKNNINNEKLFCANNTILWTPIPDFSNIKVNFIFIGTLYKKKRVDLLIKSVKQLHGEGFQSANLIIVGNGEEKGKLENLVLEIGLDKSVFFLGEINNEVDLQAIYNKALLCISPGQAGLTVLQSMAAGVTFVTSKDAITGGEIDTIENGVNGIVYDGSLSTLYEIMKDSLINPSKYIEMGKAARLKYETEFTLDTMVNNFMKCLEYAIEN
jgi:glycosyltransferase involved in cell wall biosynthesis